MPLIRPMSTLGTLKFTEIKTQETQNQIFYSLNKERIQREMTRCY